MTVSLSREPEPGPEHHRGRASRRVCRRERERRRDLAMAVAVSLVVAVAASLDPDVFTDLDASVDVTRLTCLPPGKGDEPAEYQNSNTKKSYKFQTIPVRNET